MDPRELPPLRSGLGLPGQGLTTQIDASHMQQRLIAAVAVMTRKSSAYAYKLCCHDKRTEVTAEDVNVALKYHARHFLSTIDHPDVVEEIIRMQQEIFESDDDDDDDSSGSTRSSTGSSADMDVGVRVDDPAFDQCACEDCVEMRHCAETWAEWEPEDSAEAYMKKSVDMSMQMARARM